MKKILLVLFSSSALLTACNSGSEGAATNQSNQQIETVKSNTGPLKSIPNNPVINFGTPFYHAYQLPLIGKDSCVALSNPVTESSANFDLKTITDEKTVENTLGVSASISGGWGSFSSSTTNEFFKSTEEHSKNLSFTFLSSYGQNTTYNATLNQTGINAMKSAIDRSNLQDFYSACGDSFVVGGIQSNVIAVNLDINFATEEEADSFKNETGATISSFGDIKTAVTNSSKEFNSNASITFSAMQLGGDPSKLALALKKFEPSGASSYPVLNCTMSNFDMCTQAYNAVLDYSTTNFINQPLSSSVTTPTIVTYNDTSTTSFTDQKYIDFINSFKVKTPSVQESSAIHTLTELQKSVDEYSPYFLGYDLNDKVRYPVKFDYGQYIKQMQDYIAYSKNQYPQIADLCYDITGANIEECVNEVSHEHDKLNNNFTLNNKPYSVQDLLDNYTYYIHYFAHNQSNSGSCKIKNGIGGGYICDDFQAVPLSLIEDFSEAKTESKTISVVPSLNGGIFWNNEKSRLDLSYNNGSIKGLTLNQRDKTHCYITPSSLFDHAWGATDCQTDNADYNNAVIVYIEPVAYGN